MQGIDWQMVISKHGPAVWQRVYRLLGNEADAAECFQETFVSALKVSRRQRIYNFGALLASIAASRAVDKLRQRIRERRIQSGYADLDDLAGKSPGPPQEVQRRELAVLLREVIGRLPRIEAEIFCLRHLNGMSYRRIAKELGVKTNTVGAYLHRARNKIRQNLEKAGEKPKSR